MILNKIRFMLRTALIITITALLLISCSEKKKISGKDFIPRKELVQILTDMHLIDGITNDTRYYRKYNPGDSIDMYGWIFDKYHITKEEYLRTIAEYSKYPNLLDQVYDEVLMQLNLLLENEENPSNPEKGKNMTPAEKKALINRPLKD